MHRVKAFRSLQKIQEKQLVEIIAHGKMRRLMLKPSLLEMLRDSEAQ